MICVCGTKLCKLKMVSDILDRPVFFLFQNKAKLSLNACNICIKLLPHNSFSDKARIYFFCKI